MHNFLHRLLQSCLPSLSLSMLIACGPPGSQASQPQVIGGKNAAAPSYFVAIHQDGDKTPFCGGSLIAKNIVLTAAHCVNQNRGPISVWIGIETLNNLPQARPVQARLVHPQYHASRYQHDLAQLFLSEAKTSEEPDTIPLSAAPKPSGPLHVFGLGNTSRTGYEYPNHLQTAELTEIPGYACQTLGGPYDYILSEQVCAGDFQHGTRDTCDGDSGGPLVTNGSVSKLYGIVSWGVGCGLAGRPGVYTRVASYREWMKTSQDQILNGGLPLEELIGAIFYFPLIESIQLPSGVLRQRRFTAAYHHWQVTEKPEHRSPSAHWQRSFQGKQFKLALYPLAPQRYQLRLSFDGKNYESLAQFSEIIDQN